LYLMENNVATNTYRREIGQPLREAHNSSTLTTILPGTCHHYSQQARAWSLPESEGSGWVQWFTPRRGISIVIQDYTLATSVCTSVQLESLPLKFNFCLSGRISAEIAHYKPLLTMRKLESSMLSFQGEFSGTMQREAGEPIQMITIFIDPPLLSAYLAQDFATIPVKIERIMTRQASSELKGQITSRMHLLLEDLLHFHYEGPVSRLLLEARALELISCQLTQYLAVQRPSTQESLERERVLLARDLLIRNMEYPPTLDELARRAGVSHTKLIQLFRTVYGTTPFRYLRDWRLAKARELLEAGNTNVTEVAYSIGYNCMSFFAKAFKEKYGIAPSECQQHKK
jgi:AraC family transcriptional regulator, transcriptional activator of the genes for pyochelin and ferripyochelin receptors